MTEPTELLAPQAAAHHASERPNQVVFQTVDGDELTWREVHEQSLRWADALEQLGVASGDAVVSMFPNGIDAALSWLGCAWLKAIEAPLNTSYKGAWLVHAINLTGASVAVVHERYLEAVVAVAPDLEHLRTVVVFGGSPIADVPFEVVAASEFLASGQPTERVGPDVWDIAALIFTSGTTGPSKAVMVPWGQFQSLERIDWGPRPGPRVGYSPFSPYHVTGKGPIFAALTRGGRVVFRETFSTEDFWPDIRKFGCTDMVMVGPIAGFLSALPEQPDDRDHPLDFVLMGPVIADVDAFRERFGVRVHTCFNMTEINAPVTSTGHSVTDETYRSCGRVRDGVEVRIVDEHDLQVPPGTPGEMIVRSEPWTLNLGYWGMAEKTTEAWRNGWFHTGDTFTYDDDGNFFFHDRAKDYIRRRGENISSFEVEACVNVHPDVAECAAVAVPSPEGEDEVKIAVVLAPQSELSAAELFDFLVPRMPRFAIPRYIDLVDELPKTEATQRVQKAQVRSAGITSTTWDRVEAGRTVPK